MDSLADKNKHGFGTSAVFFTAISTILGAILFLRFGFAVGTLGFGGALLIVLLGHLVTIPTALAVSEIATNKKVEGGGSYYIISRSFGLNIGATIGISLYLSEAISVAFYIIAFTEAFEPVFNWVYLNYGLLLPRQVVSLPVLALLSALILTKGAKVGIRALYGVVAVLFVSLVLFFIGGTSLEAGESVQGFSGTFKNMNSFFFIFAIIFPAFTGMAAGVGLSGDLKNPGKSIPRGTLIAIFTGMLVYVAVIWMLTSSVSTEALIGNQLVMSKIAKYGWIAIPLGLAASTISSAIGTILIAPRTLQAIGTDKSFPIPALNRFTSKGKEGTNDPFNATIISILIAFVFVAMGNVNSVAMIITMFYLVTYSSICLISFLNHFASDPSYRPTFRSKWYISLIGFLFSIWLMFKINSIYAFSAIFIMSLIYLGISNYHKDRKGFQSIFKGALFQLNRKLNVFIQRKNKLRKNETWRPSAICVSKDSLERDSAFKFLNWISYKYGFGTYIHMIEGFYNKETYRKAMIMKKKLIVRADHQLNSVYIDTIISPSYTSALAQAIQLPGISGMENNMVVFEYSKNDYPQLKTYIDNFNLVLAGNYDACIMASSVIKVRPQSSIHVWIRSFDYENSNLMILLSYIISGHPDWHKSTIKIFDISNENDIEKARESLIELVKSGRIPITPQNIEIIRKDENVSSKLLINQHSADAGLTIIGFRPEHLQTYGIDLFKGYDQIGDVIFVNSHEAKEIE